MEHFVYAALGGCSDPGFMFAAETETRFRSTHVYVVSMIRLLREEHTVSDPKFCEGFEILLVTSRRHDAVILVPVFGEAVQQNDHRTSPAAHIVEGCSVRLRSAGDEPPPNVASPGSIRCRGADWPWMTAHAATTKTAKSFKIQRS